MADPACAICAKTAAETPDLKRCAQCNKAYYCSRECQRVDWKSHKKVCNPKPANPSAGPKIGHMHNYKTPSGKSLEKYIPDPFTRLENGTCLHDRPEKDVFKLLVDALRMREQDLYKLGGEIAPRSLYSGESSSIASFREFLTGVEKKNGYLPAWWNADKRKECEEFGEKGGDWSNLRKKVVKDEMIKHYGNERMPMQLRMFVEEALGMPAPGTQAEAGQVMRSIMISMEKNDKPDDKYVSMTNIDVGKFF